MYPEGFNSRKVQFQPQLAFSAGVTPAAVTIGDFNGDGKADLAATDQSSAAVDVLLGNGNGTFQTSQPFAVGLSPIAAATGDINGDGKQDLVSTDSFDGTVSVLLGNGDRTFQPRQAYAAGNGPASVTIGDFNGDGRPDLATADQSSNTVSVLLGFGPSSSVTSTVLVPLSGIDVSTQQTALAAQGQLDGYLQNVSAVSGIIGASMSRFETAARVLGVLGENDREAGSRITDADVSREAADLVKGQILQKVASEVLSYANRGAGWELRLLGVA